MYVMDFGRCWFFVDISVLRCVFVVCCEMLCDSCDCCFQQDDLQGYGECLI